MKHPKDDVPARTPVWDCLQMFFMDTDPALCLDHMAEVCAQSPYSILEIREILFNEVLPACRFNMFMFPAPEWAGFATAWLVQRVLKKQRFGRRQPIFLRGYTTRWWARLEPLIAERRAPGGK
jgi:hypothetical protein